LGLEDDERANCVARVGGRSCRRESLASGVRQAGLLMTDLRDDWRERMVAMTVFDEGWEGLVRT